MIHRFDNVVNRKNTSSLKWDCNKKIFGVEDLLPMWVADMDFEAPEAVVEGIRHRAMHGVYGYTERSEAYFETIIEWTGKRHGWNIKKDWIVYSPGVVTSINAAIMAFTNPGDKIIIQSPVYAPFFHAVEKNERQLLNNRLKLENGKFEMDFEDLENKLSSGAKMLLLCSPHNPGGRVWSFEELKKVGELCVKYDVLIMSDEIHCDLVMDGNKHIPIASISGQIADKTITCIAPSKTFNIAGLNTSSAIIPNNRSSRIFFNMVDRLGVNLGNVFGLTASEMAYKHGEEWLDSLLGYLKGNVDFVMDYFAAKIPLIKPVRPEATYLIWLDCTRLGMEQAGLREFLIKKARVGLSDGAIFGPGGEGFMRMNIGCPRILIEQALNRIAKAIEAEGIKA